MKKIFTLIAAVASAMTAFAGNTLTNADFADGVMPEVNIATYASDGAVNHMQEVPGWTIAIENIDARAAGVAAYGSGTSFGGSYYAPAAGPEGTNGNCLGMVAVWTGSVQYTQPVTLPAGSYTLTVPVCNTAGTTAFVKNLIGVKFGATEKYATTMTYAVGSWTTEVIPFELTEETEVTVSLGYNGANVGSGASQHLFIDCVKIEVADPVKVAKTEAINALPVADGTIFTPAAADIEAAKAAIEAATTVEEVAAAVPATWNIPALTGSYYVKNTNGTAYLSEAKLSAEPVAVKFEKAEKGFYINVNGKYINMAGGNTWSMAATETPAAVWNFNLADGKYTIQGPNGLIGSDNVTDGSATYGNKKTTETAKNIFWTVEVAPEPVNYTVYAKVTAGEDGSKTFVGQTLTVVEKDGVATVTLPAAQASIYSMESQKVQVNIDAEGNISMIEGQTLNFTAGADKILVTVTSVAGTLAEGKVNVTVEAAGDNGKNVKVVYSTDEIVDPQPQTITWDFSEYTERVVLADANVKVEYNGMTMVGSTTAGYTSDYVDAASGFHMNGTSSATTRHLVYTPEKAGKLTVTYRSNNATATDRITAIGTEVVKGSDLAALLENEKVLAAGLTDGATQKTITADVQAGTTYYIYLANGGQSIMKVEFKEDPTAVNVAKAAPAKAAKVAKFVKNGKVVIVKDGKMFNVAGAQM